jgi:hypothetical protein
VVGDEAEIDEYFDIEAKNRLLEGGDFYSFLTA